RDVLRVKVSLTGGRIERSLQRDIETLFLGPRPVPGKIEAFLDQGIDIDRSVFARALAPGQQHALDDGIRPLAGLPDLVDVAPECIRQFLDFSACFVVERYAL